MTFAANMVYQVETAHLNALQLVLVGTALEGSVFLFEIPTGVVADLYSRRLSVIIGVFLVGAGFLLEGSFPFFLPILLAQVLWGVGFTFTSGALTAWFTDEVGEETSQMHIIRGAQMGEAGSLAGTLLGVLLAQILINLPILISGASFLFLGVYLILYMRETGFVRSDPEERSTWGSMKHTLVSGVRLLKLKKILAYLVAAGFFYGFYSEGFDRLWTPHLLQDLAFPSFYGIKPVVWFGLMGIIGSLLTLAITEWIRRQFSKAGSSIIFGALLTSTLLIVLGLGVFALTKNLWIAVLAWVAIYVFRRAVDPVFLIWYNHRLDSKIRATMLSFSSQVDAFGQIMGGPPIGLIGKLVSIPAALVTSAITLLPAVFIYIPFTKNKNLNQLEEPAAVEAI
jgi:DHA3 family tetracycline resistance protein-like MFS transporter